jgi:NAD(P)-dependent dehydrogenase (short-subunit alcohol dehydrogenase family)
MFAKHGAKVAILDLDEAQAKEAAASIGAEHRGYVCNVTDRQACEDAVAKVVADFGTIDVLINNAGITQAAKFLDIDPQSWDRILDVNLRGVLYLSQAVVPQMKKQKSGSIGCMSSVSAQRGGGILGGPHYSAAKAGVLGLAKAMARELGGEGIRVNCVTPGLIQTDINAGKIPEDKRGEILAGIPAGRLGVPDDVAGAFLFLAADISSYITGAVIDVNGGMLIHG